MNTREVVLAALREAGPGGVSGEELARRIGVSRAAVGKHVATLQEAGYEIIAVAGKGYRLLSSPDVPTPLEVAPLLHHPLWVRVEGGLETESTNDDARALAVEGAPEGTVVVASQQTAGRGRLGREWYSPGGGAYLSAVLRPPVSPAEVSTLALVLALGTARGLQAVGANPAVKWPNDVLLAGGKVAGILLEMVAEPDRVGWVVAGIGLNVRRHADVHERAAYVSDVADVPVPVAAAAVLDAVGDVYSEWLRGGFGALRDEYESLHELSGREVTVRNAAGKVTAQGRVSGVDNEGRLAVADSAGHVVPVTAGEVTLRE